MRKPFELADLSQTAARMIAKAKQPRGSNIVPLRDVRQDAASRGQEDQK
jgi:hypothetical protein